MPLFSVRTVIQLAPRPQAKGKHLYEERITLWRVADEDEAIRLADLEAHQYAAEEIGVLPHFQAYKLYDEVTFAGESAEIFSLIRSSDLPPDEYLASFFESGGEHSRTDDA